MSIALVAFGVVAQTVSLFSVSREYRAVLVRQADGTATEFAREFSHYSAHPDTAALRALLARDVLAESIALVRWRTAAGKTIELGNVADTKEFVPGWFRALVGPVLVEKEQGIHRASGEEGTLHFEFSTAALAEHLWRTFVDQMLLMGLTALVLFGAIAWLMRRNLSQLDRLAGLARRFAKGDYEARIEVDSRSAAELQEVSAIVNDMARRTQDLIVSLTSKRTAMDHAALVVEYDMDGLIGYVNDRFCLACGYKREELLGRPGRFLDGDDSTQVLDECWRTVAEGKIWRGEVEYRARNGMPFWVDSTITPCFNKGGQLVKYIAVQFDISARKRAENLLREQVEFVQVLLDAIPMPVFFKDTQGRYLGVNCAWEQFFGRERQAFLGSNVLDLYPGHPDVAARHHAMDQELLAHPGVQTYEALIPAAHGMRDTLYTKATFSNGDGKVMGVIGVINDLTQFKQSEEMSKRLGRIFEQSLNEIYVFDAETLQFLQVNRGARQNLGYLMEELHSMTPVDIKPEFTREAFEQYIAPLRKGEVEQVLLETRHRRRDGTDYPVEIRLQLSRTESSPVFFAIVEDITERRAAEAALLASEERFRTLVESTSDWVWEVNEKGVYTYASPRVRDILGYEPETVVGRSPFDFMPPQEAQRVSAAFSELAAERKPLVMLENVNLHRSGRRVVLESSGLPIFDQQGNYRGYRGIDRDISLRTLAEEAYRESEARFRSMAGNVPGMVFQFALQAEGELVFRYVSDGALALCGCNPQHLLEDAQNFLWLVAQEDRAGFLTGLAESVRELTAWNWEGRISASAGAGGEKWVNWRASPRLLGDGTILWDGVVVNVSETRAAQQALLHSQEQLQSLSAYLQTVREEEKSHIAREIHDELGGTLTALKMDAYWLAKKLPEQYVQLHGKLSSILTMVDGAVQTTRRISTELRPTVLDDLGLMAAIEWQVSEFQKRMAIDCVFHRPARDVQLSEPMSIALFRILQESLTNVARHAQASSVFVVFQATEHEVFLAIEDNGRGIEPLAMEAGHSHGLRGIRERARHFGGDVDIIGAPDGGTVVMVQFPLQQLEEQGEPT